MKDLFCLFCLIFLVGLPGLAAGQTPAPDCDAIAAPAASLPQWSPARLVIEGDAHRCRGEAGPATLAYLRAQRLAPDDPQIAERLDAIALAAGQTPADDGPWALIERVRLEVWAWTSAALAALAALLFGVGFRWTHRYRGAIAAAVLAVGVGTLADRAAAPLRASVVVAPQAVARVSPAASAPVAFDLRPGRILTPGARRDGFVRVEADGQVGWVEAGALASVVPGGPS